MDNFVLLEELQKFKFFCVEKEDFDGAKILKEIIQLLETKAGILTDLGDRKKLAIEEENYDVAKDLKQQEFELSEDLKEVEKGIVSHIKNKDIKALEHIFTNSQRYEGFFQERPQNMDVSFHSSVEERPILLNPSPQLTSRKETGRYQSQPSDLFSNEIPQNIQEEFKLSLAHPMVGPSVFNDILSPKINVRVSALRRVQDSFKEKPTDELIGLFKFLEYSSSDSAPDVLSEVVYLGVQLLSEKGCGGRFGVEESLDKTVKNVLKRLNLLPSQPQVSAFFLKAANVLGLPKVVQSITTVKKDPLWKNLLMRLSIISAMLQKFSSSINGEAMLLIEQFLNHASKHSNRKVREKAIQIRKHSARGSPVSSAPRVSSYYQEDVVPTSLDENQVELGGSFESSELSDNELSNVCAFCDSQDVFEKSEDLDDHYLHHCRMLAKCPRCPEIIQIKDLNTHLLQECIKKRSHVECSRCGEAIASKYYQLHKKRNSCLIRLDPTEGSRCPLCHKNITKPGEEGWKWHLLEVKCPKNPRC
eukprot:augustus_masked-scaffold_7-processed-gene-5.13-mRNA-1 protein AED:0.75 eAED:0.75 QI:0/-1/0/1/-1/1/1/0/530